MQLSSYLSCKNLVLYGYDRSTPLISPFSLFPLEFQIVGEIKQQRWKMWEGRDTNDLNLKRT